MKKRLIIVDAANVVGSVPDGWWRDRVGATRRLRDRLAATANQGVLEGADIVLVVEGRARGVESLPEVAIVDARGSGDDAIVALVEQEAGSRPCVVVTADRALRDRVSAHGASVLGPSAVRHES